MEEASVRIGMRVSMNGWNHTGTVVGLVPEISHRGGKTFVVVDLDQGFYSEDRSTFVSLLVAHADSLSEGGRDARTRSAR